MDLKYFINKMDIIEGSDLTIDTVPAVSIEENPKDQATIDIPLLIRLLEYAREDANSDMDLHQVTEKIISLSKEGNTLTMDDYDSIVNIGDGIEKS
jgi:hypothetical protein